MCNTCNYCDDEIADGREYFPAVGSGWRDLWFCSMACVNDFLFMKATEESEFTESDYFYPEALSA